MLLRADRIGAVREFHRMIALYGMMCMSVWKLRLLNVNKYQPFKRCMLNTI